MGGLKKTETERGGIDRYETPKDLSAWTGKREPEHAALLCLAHLAAIIDGRSQIVDAAAVPRPHCALLIAGGLAWHCLRAKNVDSMRDNKISNV